MSTVQTATRRFVWHDHVSDDPQKAQDFYTKLLGWETEVWGAGEFDYPMIKVDDRTHGGFGPAQGGAPPHWLGHIGVDDVDATVAKAKKAGGKLMADPMDIPEVGRTAVIADPQGAVFSVFSSASDDWTPTEGVFLWDELTTTDVEAAKAFYGEVIGWTTTDMDMGEGRTYTIFEADGVQRAGCMAVPRPEIPPNWMSYLGTDDVDAKCKEAEKMGAKTLMAPMDIPNVGRFAVLTDPTGAVFSLFKAVPS